MRIVAHINAPVLKLISLDEFLPLGRNSIQMFAPAIVERYNFQAHGEPEGGANSYIFQNGRFVFSGVETPILSLDIQASKIQGVCTTTAQTLAFLDDMNEFLVKEFQFRSPAKPASEFLSSAIVVDFESSIIDQISGIAKIHDLLNSHMGRALTTPLHAQGLRFSARMKLGKEKEGAVFYILEERIGRPAGTDWLFSHAPFSSDAHVVFLNELSRLFDTRKVD